MCCLIQNLSLFFFFLFPLRKVKAQLADSLRFLCEFVGGENGSLAMIPDHVFCLPRVCVELEVQGGGSDSSSEGGGEGSGRSILLEPPPLSLEERQQPTRDLLLCQVRKWLTLEP